MAVLEPKNLAHSANCKGIKHHVAVVLPRPVTLATATATATAATRATPYVSIVSDMPAARAVALHPSEAVIILLHALRFLSWPSRGPSHCCACHIRRHARSMRETAKHASGRNRYRLFERLYAHSIGSRSLINRKSFLGDVAPTVFGAHNIPDLLA